MTVRYFALVEPILGETLARPGGLFRDRDHVLEVLVGRDEWRPAPSLAGYTLMGEPGAELVPEAVARSLIARWPWPGSRAAATAKSAGARILARVAAFDEDQHPRDATGKWTADGGGGQDAALHEWAKGHPRGTVYRAMSEAELAKTRESGTFPTNQRGEVWVSDRPKGEYLDPGEVLVALHREPADTIGAGAPGDYKLGPIPADRIIDVYRPRTAAFDEEQHPRDDHGRWTSGDGGATQATAPSLVDKYGHTKEEWTAALQRAFPNAGVTIGEPEVGPSADPFQNSFATARAEQMASAVAAADELAHEYPKVAESIDNVEFVDLSEGVLGSFYGGGGPSGVAIKIDPLQIQAAPFPKEPGTLATAQADRRDVAFSVMTHEFGHAVDHYASDGADDTAFRVWQDAQNHGEQAKRPSDVHYGSQAHISPYSMTSYHEYFAEAFTADRLGYGDRLTADDKAMLAGADTRAGGPVPAGSVSRPRGAAAGDDVGEILDTFEGSIVWAAPRPRTAGARILARVAAFNEADWERVGGRFDRFIGETAEITTAPTLEATHGMMGAKLNQDALARFEKETGLTYAQAVEHTAALLEQAKQNGTYAASKDWYETANQMIGDRARELGIDPEQLAALVAASSPRMPWDEQPKGDPTLHYPNLELAAAFARMAADPNATITFTQADVEKWNAWTGGMHHDATEAPGTYSIHDPNVSTETISRAAMSEVRSDQGYVLLPTFADHAWDIALGRKPPEEALAGAKVRAFNNQLLTAGRSDFSVIDTWMLKAVTGNHSADPHKALDLGGGYITTQGGTHAGTVGLFPVYDAVIKDVYAGARVADPTLTLGGTQAAIWTLVRDHENEVPWLKE